MYRLKGEWWRNFPFTDFHCLAGVPLGALPLYESSIEKELNKRMIGNSDYRFDSGNRERCDCKYCRWIRTYVDKVEP